MAMREALNRNRTLVTVLAIAVIVVAVYFAVQEARSSFGAPYTGGGPYYTVDDGKTWFPADGQVFPPFDKGGKPAVRAYLFRCGEGDMFVGYLERYTPEARSALEDFTRAKASGQPPKNMAAVMDAETNGKEVKKPGEGNWVKFTSGAARMVMDVPCEGGVIPERLVP